MMELGFKSSQTSESTGKLFGTFPGAYFKNPAPEKYYLHWFNSKCQKCPTLALTCCHQSFAFQNKAIDSNINKWRYIDNSNFSIDVLLFLLNYLLSKFSAKLKGKRCWLLLNFKLYTAPLGYLIGHSHWTCTNRTLHSSSTNTSFPDPSYLSKYTIVVVKPKAQVSFFIPPFPIYIYLLSMFWVVLLPKCILNLYTFPLLLLPSCPSHHHLLPGLLHSPPRQTSCFHHPTS